MAAPVASESTAVATAARWLTNRLAVAAWPIRSSAVAMANRHTPKARKSSLSADNCCVARASQSRSTDGLWCGLCTGRWNSLAPKQLWAQGATHGYGIEAQKVPLCRNASCRLECPTLKELFVPS